MQENHPTGLLAGGAFAPYKRFRRRRKPWRRDGFAIPSILIPKGGAALWAAEPKKKDMTKGHVFLFGTPEGTRTPNIQNRNLTLYPIELRALINRSIIIAGLPRVVKCYFKNFFLFSNPFWNGPRHVCCLPKNVLPPRRHISLNLKFECGAAEAAFSDPFAGRTALFCVQLQKACGAM